MPFASLRRRTAADGERTNLQDKQTTPSASVRGRSITLPTISPRKSFSSMLGSAKRGRSGTPSPEKSDLDVLEQDLYPEYDSSNPDHNPPTAPRTPPVDKPRRFRRAPSPHPLKGSMSSMTSRLSRMNRGALHKTRSQSCLTQTSPPKSFFETLADAIRAPATFFYKENKPSPESEGANLCASEPTQSRSASPKKSVRFRPGKSFIEPEPRSSPIDIPKPTPSLPPVQLASTPIQQCFEKVPSDPVPTARPPEPQILKSPATFRQAIAATDPSAILKDFEKSEGGRAPLSGLSAPLHESSSAIQNPFEDPVGAADHQATNDMLEEDAGSYMPPQASRIRGAVAEQRLNVSEASSRRLINSDTTSAVAWIRAHDDFERATSAAHDNFASHSISPSGSEMPSFSHVEYARDNHSALPLTAIDPDRLSSGPETPSLRSPPDIGSSTNIPDSNNPLFQVSTQTTDEAQGSLSMHPNDSSNDWSQEPSRADIPEGFKQSMLILSSPLDQAALMHDSESQSMHTNFPEVAPGGLPLSTMERQQSNITCTPSPESESRPAARATQSKKALWQGNEPAVTTEPECVDMPSKAPRGLVPATSVHPGSSWTAELALRGSKPYTTPLQSPQPSQPQTVVADIARQDSKESVTGNPSLSREKVVDPYPQGH
ncbi:hypothetical protein A1O1_05442 [Capronia coronata CBS 617.96]|uniref:Uncharacterized protein n=1 Tax=Capronia coronata CBS 617.96 TaxID=1182541 RepID=W9Y6Q3_9EURO|nr:uncharacterized protein A1O1_05442 [Capronia coronata CBS 617.96]EXJ88512.1 hypothetical protein A1O1_05442 [Capronia coronata CBS 617.96]